MLKAFLHATQVAYARVNNDDLTHDQVTRLS
jgi:hypothetical protein